MEQDDERAAKAARAKALLDKRRQQKKTREGSGIGSPVSPSPPRTYSPAPTEENKRDIGDLFRKDDTGDASWINTLTRVGTPPPPKATPVAVLEKTPSPSQSPQSLNHASAEVLEELRTIKAENLFLSTELQRLPALESKLNTTEVQLKEQKEASQILSEQIRSLEVEKDGQLQTERQTISLLVSQKASLTRELEALEEVESKARETESQLHVEREKTENLQRQVNQTELRVSDLRAEVQAAVQRSQSLEVKEKELSESLRDKERELQLTHRSVSSLQKEAEQHRRRVQELEEHIQKDDRVERLEQSLKNTQTRSDELEFQLSKLKQSHSTLKSERDDLDSQLKVAHATLEEFNTTRSQLETEITALKQQIQATLSENNSLIARTSSLEEELNSEKQARQAVQERVTQLSTELATATRELHSIQAELRSAKRRAEEAEQTKDDLQAEGTNLMRSLEEMRPKVVELTGVKLELGEKVESLERSLRNRDSTIAQLETVIDELREEREQEQRTWKETLARSEKEHSLSESRSSELQSAYSALQEELNSSLASSRSIDAEKAALQAEVSRYKHALEDAKASAALQAEELAVFKEEVHERRADHEEEKEFLATAQNEIESLRLELELKREELDKFRTATVDPEHRSSESIRSLDDEVLSSIKQQHSLEISASQSRMRALENSLFESEARVHTLTKRLAALEDQVALQPRRNSFSPTIESVADTPSRPASRNDVQNGAARSVLIQSFSLSPETRHKRHVSLAMLKTRMDREAAVLGPKAGLPSPTSLEKNRAQQSHKVAGMPSLSQQLNYRRRFLDESHVFWCHCCTGDLVVL